MHGMNIYSAAAQAECAAPRFDVHHSRAAKRRAHAAKTQQAGARASFVE